MSPALLDVQNARPCDRPGRTIIPMKPPPAGRVAAFARLVWAISEGDDLAARRFQHELRTLGVSCCRTRPPSTQLPPESPGPITCFALLVKALDAHDFKAARQQRRMLRHHGYSIYLLTSASICRAPQHQPSLMTKREGRASRQGSPFSNSQARSTGEFPPAGVPGPTP